MNQISFITFLKRSIFALGIGLMGLLSSCMSVTDENNVEVLDKGALAPATFSVVGPTDKGEFLVGSDKVIFELEVKNNSTSFLSNLNLEINPLATAAMKFAANEEGRSESPGFGGTCASVLAARTSCRYRIEFKPTFSGRLSQDFVFTYKNLVESGKETAEITLLAGEAASLIFDGERINYDLGVLERTDREKIVTNLNITNVGGLSARNLIFGKIDNTASEPFKVIENNCPDTLKIGQNCQLTVEFESQNYGPGAPDGDIDTNYSSNIRYDFVREPGGGLGSLTAFFAVNSTKIRGILNTSGVDTFSFPEITVGNKESTVIKIQNNGFKEAILHHVDLYDASNAKIARCSRFSGNQTLVCQDPSDTGLGGTNLTLAQLPLRIVDNLDCLIEYQDTGYTRNPDGSLSVPDLREIKGRTVSQPGESCVFGVEFQPSVEYMAAGNINGYQIKFVYDSTWKNNREIKEDTYGDGPFHTINEASWRSAGLLVVNDFRYGPRTFTDNDGNVLDLDGNVNDSHYLFDLGRVALVSDSNFKERLGVFFQNIGGSNLEIVSIKDGGSPQFTFSDLSADLNNYYQRAFAVNCGILDANGGTCNIGADLVPLAASGGDAQQQENNAMYDVQNGYPEQYKKFFVEYRDGALYEDDGVTPRPIRTVEVSVRSLLVRKGFLVFEDTSFIQGRDNRVVDEGTAFHFIKLKNAGTGGIPYITSVTGRDLAKPTSGDNLSPFEYVDRPGTAGEEGADKDCFDFLNRPADPDPTAIVGSTAPSVLDPGETCSLAVKMKIRSTDVELPEDYVGLNASSSLPNMRVWWQSFSSELQNDPELWESIRNQFPVDRYVRFDYYDGDGVPNVATDHTPDLEGYGNLFPISGGNEGQYQVGLSIRRKARLYPSGPSPSLNGVICRDEIFFPELIPDPVTEWGDPRPAFSFPEKCVSSYGEEWSMDDIPAVKGVNPMRAKIKAEESNYDYVYHAGSWKTGDSYSIGFSLNSEGGISSALEVVSINYSGDTTVITLDEPIGATINDERINFTFNPTVDGPYETVLEIVYKNQAEELIDEANFVYQDKTSIFRIKIRADAVSNVGTPTLTVQDYMVTYDPVTELVDDTALDGPAYSSPLYLFSTDENSVILFSAIRDAEVFAKKVLTITNNDVNPMVDLNFNLKEAINSPSYSNTVGGSGISITSNTCVGITLNNGESCEVTIIFNAGPFEAAARQLLADVSYKISDEAYYQENTIIRFEARDPAILNAVGVIPESIQDPSGNIIAGSYGINLGFYGSGNPVVNNFPTHTYGRETIQIVNSSSEKASFLAQWRQVNGNDPLPASAYINIYNSDGMTAEASRGCFFGDDEFLPIDEDTKGFNNTSANGCYVNLYYSFDDTFLGENLDTAFTNFRLFFYNNERASSDYIAFHFKGFAEPNRSSQPNNEISNVVSTNSGTVSFSWEPATPQNAAWGDIVGYRVFYSTSSAPLNDIFSPSLSFVDTVDPEVSLSSLATGTYYYFKVAARRESPQSGKIYTSDMGMATKTIIVPPANYIYDYTTKSMISMRITSSGGGYGSKSEAKTFCSSETILMAKNGSTENLRLSLIDSEIYGVIDSDPANSNYPYQTVPHWMSDGTVDISTVFDPFDCSVQSGSDGDISFYQKDCNDCSCNSLSLMIGGDGLDLPIGARVYADGEAFDAAVRCYLPE